MDLVRFIALRPFLYHLTSLDNITSISQTRTLFSAAELRRRAGLPGYIEKRKAHDFISINGHRIAIRDQSPLHAGNIDFADGFTMEDMLTLLNGLVFFWPGTERGPIAYGIRHYARYSHERPAVIRVRTERILRNPNSILVCQYNSGSPRWNAGRASPRGAATFVGIEKSVLKPSSVVELVSNSPVSLEESTLVSRSGFTEWEKL